MKFRMYLVMKHNNIRYHKVHFAVSLEDFCVTFSDSERDKLSGEVRTSVGVSDLADGFGPAVQSVGHLQTKLIKFL